jgi:hypothetical protein
MWVHAGGVDVGACRWRECGCMRWRGCGCMQVARMWVHAGGVNVGACRWRECAHAGGVNVFACRWRECGCMQVARMWVRACALRERQGQRRQKNVLVVSSHFLGLGRQSKVFTPCLFISACNKEAVIREYCHKPEPKLTWRLLDEAASLGNQGQRQALALG